MRAAMDSIKAINNIARTCRQIRYNFQQSSPYSSTLKRFSSEWDKLHEVHMPAFRGYLSVHCHFGSHSCTQIFFHIIDTSRENAVGAAAFMRHESGLFTRVSCC